MPECPYIWKTTTAINTHAHYIYRKVLSGIVAIAWYQGIVRAQKSMLTILFLMAISQNFTVLVLYLYYQLSDHIISERICLKFCHAQPAMLNPHGNARQVKEKLLNQFQ
jgi:hypothetical protein